MRIKLLRWLGFGALIIICSASVLAVVGSCVWNWRYGLPVHDDTKMATINTVAVLAALVIAVLAGVVAILAYIAASGRPALEVTLTFPFSSPNAPRLRLGADPGEDAVAWPFEFFKQVDGTVTLTNSSSYAARNPGVRIKFHGIMGLIDNNVKGWEVISFVTTVGVTEIQWDGGADRMIHGEWSRVLPGFTLRGAQWIRNVEKPSITVTVVADGISPVSTVYPIELQSEST